MSKYYNGLTACYFVNFLRLSPGLRSNICSLQEVLKCLKKIEKVKLEMEGSKCLPRQDIEENYFLQGALKFLISQLCLYIKVFLSKSYKKIIPVIQEDLTSNYPLGFTFL